MWWAGAIQGAQGLIQTASSLASLAKLNSTPAPRFEQTPEMRMATSQAAQRANSGFTPEQLNAYNAQLATAGNTAFRRGVDMAGGNMAGALNSALNAQQLGARNRLAVSNAELQNQNVRYRDSLYGQGQQLKNMQTQYEQQQRQQAQQAWGQALQSGIWNVAQGAANTAYGIQGPQTGQGNMPAYGQNPTFNWSQSSQGYIPPAYQQVPTTQNYNMTQQLPPQFGTPFQY